MGSVKRAIQTVRRQFSSSARAARKQLQHSRKTADWAGVVHAARTLLRDDPSQAGIQLQMAEALMALGRMETAETAFKSALAARLSYPHGALRYGLFLSKLGRQSEAASGMAAQLARTPWDSALKQGLFEVGGRGVLPVSAYVNPRTEALHGREAIRSAVTALGNWVDDRAYDLGDYDTFRRDTPLSAPAFENHIPLSVVVDARGGDETHLRRSLTSLMDQTDGQWTAKVLMPEALIGHPVASYAVADRRIRLLANTDPAPTGPALILIAGTVLHPAAIGWFADAVALVPDSNIVCDHDHYDTDWKADLIYSAPVLRGVVSSLDDAEPAAALAYVTKLPDTDIAARLAAIAAEDNTAHLPRLLASVPSGATALASRSPDRSGFAVWPEKADQISIHVIIPTRDGADLLDRCVKSMLALARYPDRVVFTVLDNNSVQPETTALLQRLAGREGNRVVKCGTAFNWSLLNNTGAEGATEDILLFANNDLEMLTQGWDAHLLAQLDDSRVGVVGARLFYENRTLQHVGIALGSGSGRPSHEGVGATSVEGGPLDRWKRTRQVAAVTGAFMAVRREVFDAVGGFSTRLAVAYNDIDFCLKVREQGLAVVMAGDLELIHFESATRGFNNTPAKVRWDDDELRDLYAIWGKAMLRDPSRNPQWHGSERNVFESWRDLNNAEVRDWLSGSANGEGWKVQRKV